MSNVIVRRAGFALTLICAFLAGAISINLYQVHHERDLKREVVRLKLEALRAAYMTTGVKGIRQLVADESAYQHDSSFVDLQDKNRTLRLWSGPTDAEKTLSQTLDGSASRQEWLNLPASEHRVWTIARTKLPDGDILFTGIASDYSR